MGEGGGRGGIGKIISRDEHSLDGSNGSGSGSGNSFLEGTQISGEGGLVTDSGGDSTEEGRHFGAGLSESEDVINEQKHILVLFVSEVLSDGESGKSDTGSGTWGLVHLSVDEGGLGAVTLDIDDTGFNHFVVEIVTFTGSLADTSEHGVTTMSLSDIVNELHDEDGLSDTGTTEESNLSSSGVGSEEIDNLDTSNEEISTVTLLSEGRRVSVNGSVLISVNGTTLIDGLSNNIDNSTEGLGTDGYQNGGSDITDTLSSHETLSGVEGNSADVVSSEMLGDLENETVGAVLDLEGI
jgi:hypothetical protein